MAYSPLSLLSFLFSLLERCLLKARGSQREKRACLELMMKIFFKQLKRCKKRIEEDTLDKNSLFTLLEKDLSEEQKINLLQEIDELDLSTFEKQKEAFFTKNTPIEVFKPFKNFSEGASKEDQKSGEELLKQGAMGCLLVAGGQGTRLGFEGPKGCYPISLIKKKSLFQLFAEKTLAASQFAGRPLQLAIMTSPQNDLATKGFFEEHRYFGLNRDQIDFFMQGELPFLDNEATPLLDSSGRFVKGPDGNGRALKYFVESGIWQRWKKLGIRFVNFNLVDNALADPFDTKLLGFHQNSGADLTIKCVHREKGEKVGLLIETESGLRVLEYSEAPEEVFDNLAYSLANISIFCLNIDFVKEASAEELPLHRAYKKAGRAMAWKFEYFIFDILPFAKKIAVLICPKNSCFAALKTVDGPDGIAATQDKLLANDRKILQEITGCSAPTTPFELSPEFYYPASKLLSQWKGKKSFESNYICP